MSTFVAVWSFIGRYKYVITIALFLLIICFAGEDSLLAIYQRHSEMEQLREDLRVCREEYLADSAALSRLENDPEEAERVAREMYLMKRPGEDVYVFVGEIANTDTLK